ncbi:hypothetical protein BGW38_006524 [Lunasporangiospora selenospora]|uniref:Ig-like domain-containing protein n=1 Tax=Lunasporangiospora selenospora TaxID=979761 RepID=A0A9P6FLR5_9FUNG|nr:hypothetical protein BGW38_006524 [Lunasporangiospora selenospora]
MAKRRPLSTTRVVLLLATVLLCTLPGAFGYTCALPTAGGSYKAGDPIALAIGEGGGNLVTPGTFNEIQGAITASLYCKVDKKLIGQTAYPDGSKPFNWVVPSVGNATIPGGTIGTCAGNAFNIVYTFSAKKFLIPSGQTVNCPDITILPDPNLPKTTTTTTTTTTTMTSTTSSSSSASPTETTDKSSSGSKMSPTTIIIVAVVAFVILVLIAVAVYFHLRRQKIKRMENAIMPWSNQNDSRAKLPMEEASNAHLTERGNTKVSVDAAVASPTISGGGSPRTDRSGYERSEYGQFNQDDYYNANYATEKEQFLRQQQYMQHQQQYAQQPRYDQSAAANYPTPPSASYGGVGGSSPEQQHSAPSYHSLPGSVGVMGHKTSIRTVKTQPSFGRAPQEFATPAPSLPEMGEAPEDVPMREIYR